MEKNLFRAKKKDNNEWVTGYLLKKYILPANCVLDCTKSDNGSLAITASNICEIDRETLCRCTELKDIANTILFEGDKVEAIITFPHSVDCIKVMGVIIWDSGAFFVKYDKGRQQPIYNCSCLKKIGRI